MADKVFKKSSTKTQRFVRMLLSIFNLRALGHSIKIFNYYNYTHASELTKMQRGEGLRISPTVSFANGSNISIGKNTRIGAGAHIWAGNGSARIIIGKDVLIAPCVMITSANYRFNDGVPINDQAMEEADVVIGADVWIGYGAVVLPGTKIGDGAVIGAASLVRGVVPENAVISNQESRIVGYRHVHDPSHHVELREKNDGVDSFIKETITELDDKAFTGAVEDAGIDSFDLITLRMKIETRFNVQISDKDWSAIKSLSDLSRLSVFSALKPILEDDTVTPVRFTSAEGQYNNVQANSPIGQGHRSRELTMPKMALSGLSESWLFKELGDIHWEMICKFLRTDSSKITDETGDRLYATFTRISLNVEGHLREFRENEAIDLSSELQRYGSGFFFGNHTLTSPSTKCEARTMSTFAKYGEYGKNTSLMKGTPLIPQADQIPSLSEFPQFGSEYRAGRAIEPAESLFECDYEILPPHDINGVGLLYFAAYPTIFDLCIERFEGKGFLLGSSTGSKDIMYFANSDPTETLNFKLHSVKAFGDVRQYDCSLYRASDGKRMAWSRFNKTVLQ